MLTPILNNTEFVELMKAIQQSKRIVVCAHRGPDGDAVKPTAYSSTTISTPIVVSPNWLFRTHR